MESTSTQTAVSAREVPALQHWFYRGTRWLYRGQRPSGIAKTLNRAWAALASRHARSNGLVALEVVGRTSGRAVTLPLVMVTIDGQRYLASMLGADAQWVRNVRTSGGRAVVRSGGREAVRLEEVPAAERAPILKAYLQAAPGARPHVPVSPDAPLPEFQKVAAGFPVFRLAPDPTVSGDPGRPDDRGARPKDLGMTRSRQIASFLGPTVMVLAISETMNLRIWETGNAPLTYLAGLAWFLGGLAIVRTHNRWSTGWPVAITLVGWFFLMGGLFRMVFPEVQRGNENTPAIGTYAVNGLLLAVGVLMTLKAFRPPPEGASA